MNNYFHHSRVTELRIDALHHVCGPIKSPNYKW